MELRELPAATTMIYLAGLEQLKLGEVVETSTSRGGVFLYLCCNN
jgi:hypothetical protein